MRRAGFYASSIRTIVSPPFTQSATFHPFFFSFLIPPRVNFIVLAELRSRKWRIEKKTILSRCHPPLPLPLPIIHRRLGHDAYGAYIGLSQLSNQKPMNSVAEVSAVPISLAPMLLQRRDRSAKSRGRITGSALCVVESTHALCLPFFSPRKATTKFGFQWSAGDNDTHAPTIAARWRRRGCCQVGIAIISWCECE